MEICGNVELDRDIDYLQKWFEDNKNLPNKIDRLYLTRFYYRCAKDVEETQKILESHFVMRNKSPNLYFNRDPDSQDTLNTAEVAFIMVLPGMTPDKNRISILGIRHSDPKKIHFAEDVKAYVMVNDWRFSEPDVVVDNIPYFSEGVIQIIDLSGVTMNHMMRVTLGTLPAFLKYLQKACPVTIKGIHIINCPTYVNKMFAIVRPFLKQEIVDMVYFHKSGQDSLYDHIPREMMPAEYGGNSGKINDLFEDLMKSVREKRDYLMDPNYWTIEK